MECTFENCPNFERLGKQFSDRISELEQENEKLKEEVDIRDNLSETFRKEALNWANIANGYQKDRTKLEKVLQEIKEITSNQDLYRGKQALATKILQIISEVME